MYNTYGKRRYNLTFCLLVIIEQFYIILPINIYVYYFQLYWNYISYVVTIIFYSKIDEVLKYVI